MALARPTLLKWLRETFPAKEPALRLDSAEAEAHLRAELETTLRGRDGLSIRSASGSARIEDGWRDFLVLSIEAPGQPYGGESVHLDLDREKRLYLRAFRYARRTEMTFPVAAAAQFEAFALLAETWRQGVVARAAKREKKKRLQLRALQARLEPLARAQGFDFAFDPGATGARVHLRCDERSLGDIHVPWKTMDDAPDLLERLIGPLKRAAELGMKIKATGIPRPTAPISLEWHPRERPSSR